MPDPGETPEPANVAVYLPDLSLKNIWRQRVRFFFLCSSVLVCPLSLSVMQNPVVLKPGTPLANIYAIQAPFSVSFNYIENLLGFQDSFAGVLGKTLALSYAALSTGILFCDSMQIQRGLKL